MRVLDSAGEEVGTVELLKLGDPEAVTERGQFAPDEGLGAAVATLVGGREPRVSGQVAARLLRTGFVKVQGSGLFGGAVYVPGDRIVEVRSGVVHLQVRGEELLRPTWPQQRRGRARRPGRSSGSVTVSRRPALAGVASPLTTVASGQSSGPSSVDDTDQPTRAAGTADRTSRKG